MILDKTSIEEILYTEGSAFEAVAAKKADGIYIRTDTEQNFFEKNQIGNDSIDLRIADYGYVMLPEYDYINTLDSGDFERYFTKVNLSSKGYVIKPGGLLFVPTYERIALSGNLIGRVTGRSVFARMGLSVHCTQDKFSSGINSVVGLQVINNSPVPLMIFPYQKLAQLLIEKTGKNRHPYDGLYCAEKNYKLPQVLDKDREHYGDIEKQQIAKQIPKRIPVWKRKNSNLTIPLMKLIFSGLATIGMGVFGVLSNIVGLAICGAFDLIGLIMWTFVEYKIEDEHRKE